MEKKYKFQNRLLSYETIKSATEGDVDAVQEVLKTL